MSGYGDCTYGGTGGTYGDLCGAQGGGGGWMRRGPHPGRKDEHAHRNDDDEVLTILSSR